MTLPDTARPSPEDVLGCLEALFEWAESYDTKDWDRLAKCLAPTLRVDYRLFHGELWEALPAADLVGIASSPQFLGNKRVATQHFVGAASKWAKESDTQVVGHHQLRVAHVKYKDDALTDVAARGHCHGGAVMHYRKVDGVWKFAGVEPRAGWSEFEFDQIFTEVLTRHEEAEEIEKALAGRAVATEEHMYQQVDCSEGLK